MFYNKVSRGEIKMKFAAGLLGLLVLFFVVITGITTLFIGTGALIAHFFNLSLFHSALLCISSAFALSFFISTTARLIAKERIADELEELLDELDNRPYNHKPSKIVYDLFTKPKK